jgi:hypothetical protein
MRWTTCPILLLLCCGAAAPLASQSQGPALMPAFLAESAHEAPPRVTPRLLTAPLAQLPAAAVGARDELAAVDAWNAAGRRPAKNGFRRRLPLPQRVRLSGAPESGSWDGGALARRAGGELVWGARVDVANAYRLRLHLTGVALPAGTRIWIWGDGETRGPFGAELVGPDGDLWTPSVRGGSAWIEVELPADARLRGSAYGFTATDVLELVDTSNRRLVTHPAAATTSCLVDGWCITSATLGVIAQFRAAVASLDFVEGSDSFLCTGSLLNDTQSDFTPYLLTADHCISTQAVASTLEAVWDYYDSVCFGTFPDRSTLPASHGATLLATSNRSDFTLLRLNSVPGGRAFLGWNANASAVVHGTLLYRLSHPAPNGFPFPQAYSTSTADYLTATLCNDTGGPPINDLTKFIHSVPVTGEVFGGSSGSPMILAGGFVVGQLLGICPGVSEPCLSSTRFEQLDGAFAATYPSIAAWLAPTAPARCVPSGTRLCIDDTPGDQRFQVDVSFQTAGGSPAPGNAVPLSSLGVSSGGLFWFFNPGNPEMLVKVLNGCGLGGHYWVFYAAGTNVGLTTTVTDTVTGAHKTYGNPIGTAAPPVQDTSALPCS